MGAAPIGAAPSSSHVPPHLRRTDGADTPVRGGEAPAAAEIVVAVAAGNRTALLTYGGRSMATPAWPRASAAAPFRRSWCGAGADLVTPAYGKEYAAAIPGAHLMSGAGHLPQIKAPDTLLALLDGFVGRPQAT